MKWQQAFESVKAAAAHWAAVVEGETAKSLGVSYSRNEANNVNVSTRDGETWSLECSGGGESNEDYESRMNSMYGEGSWKGTVGASAEGSIPGFAKASGSVETSVGVTAGGSTAGTTGNRNRTSRENSYSTGGSRDETRSFGSTVSEGQSEKLQGSYALSNSRQRDFADTEQRNQSHIWNVGQDARARVKAYLSEKARPRPTPGVLRKACPRAPVCLDEFRSTSTGSLLSANHTICAPR